MLPIPDTERALIPWANEIIEQCRVSVGVRAAYCRLMHAIAETGRYDGTKALINMLHVHLDRMAAHLFSPVELKFSIDFENKYPPNYYDRAAVVASSLTRDWERNNTDMLFGRGVYDSLLYGACILKQWPQVEGPDQTPVYHKKLVMPWQFGVYREAENDINKQSALCETTLMTLPEIWRRIYHLPNSEKLFSRIKQHATKGQATAEPQSFFHQVLSTSQLNTGVQSMTRPVPGGIVQLNNDPNYAIMGPEVAVDVVQVHELWVQDETDYTTILMVEPDVLIAPRYQHTNLLIKDSRMQPYRLIQPNEVSNYFWGRSELVDLIEPQALLAMWCDDAKRLFGMQVDKLLAFISEGGMTDELYAQFRATGYHNMQQGASVEDLTPKIPPETLPLIRFMIEIINQLGGFPPILQGQGEQGVRAGVHAETLLKTASPTLRDRALLVERQCAMAADLTLSIKEAKDPHKYWTKADSVKDMEETGFHLTDLPEDWRVTVESHRSSPIFADETSQLVFASLKTGVVGPEYVIDNVNLPNKEQAKSELHKKQKQEAEFMAKISAEHPELLPAIMKKKAAGGR
jgi:hypothetical protein